jgi:hypothetical protein
MDPRDKPEDDEVGEFWGQRVANIFCRDWRGGLLKITFQNITPPPSAAGFNQSCFGGIVGVVEILKCLSNSHSIFTPVGDRL